MTKSEQQRQKKLAKKKAKDRQKHIELARQKVQLTTKAGIVALASGQPTCLVSDSCSDGKGIGHVTIVRQIPRGQYVVVIFLVDMFCLGVKDVVFRVCGASDLQVLMGRMAQKGDRASLAPGECRALVEAAVEYAASLGFKPPSDYRKVFGIFEGIERLPLPEQYKFGSEGKPLYINGPSDSFAKQQMILKTLLNNVGEGNYDFTIRVSGPDDSSGGDWGSDYLDNDADALEVVDDDETNVIEASDYRVVKNLE